MIGEEGRGLQTIVEMINFTRLDCTIDSAAGMRQATSQAAHHLAHRSAFGRLRIDQPLALNVLADLEIEAEAAELAFLRVAQACDHAPRDPAEAAFKRIGTALGKYWICKRAAPHAAEALESLGGNGYVEESIMPRLLRILAKEPAAIESFHGERRRQAVATRASMRLMPICGASFAIQTKSLRFGHPAVADAFCASRLAGDWGRVFATLPPQTAFNAIVRRAPPARLDGALFV